MAAAALILPLLGKTGAAVPYAILDGLGAIGILVLTRLRRASAQVA